MYRDHMPIIRDAMREDLEIFRRGVMFAVCSIRQPTTNVPDQLARLFDGAEGENPLFGHKFKAWEYIADNSRAALLWKKLNLFASLSYGPMGYPRVGATEAAMLAILEVPGLGIVKSAFVLQLMGFDVACLDSRNVKREGRHPRAFRTDGKGVDQLRRQVSAYLDETYGKAEQYWDAWCRDVAGSYDGYTPEAVSELHLSIVPNGYVPL